MGVSEKILAYVKTLPEGTAVTAKELLQFGSRAAVDQALTRLGRSGALIRVFRGIYVAPVESRYGTRPPSPHAVAKSLAHVWGEPVEPHGAAAANRLGLTSQVPVRPVYVTSGRARKLRLGGQRLDIQHVPKWQMQMANRPAGQAIRALAWLGESHASTALFELKSKLPAEEWQALMSARAALPSWMAKAVSEVMVGAN
ncbi:type IV toxin-antitoxin system AbiEi family antitoxin domain-containing protein [Pelagibius litoralis]|uniref:Type IV toxin-antitoxin system AbiEi family antitoxin domain-containing protein n=1 Tax=Pelagibius litoralis TaxID=374515 RepID=A0A967KCQ2_9PROT|nr:DUF6088 family protein [Pelagibius litoralis]NIA70994.1 type IV toxin-antitoxin system AbiEi family antitoxin domain-containing protein [Pelagibius litoralis]